MNEEELRKIFNAKKSRKLVNKNGKTYESPGFSSNISFNDFKKWFEQSNFEKGCFYCSTKNERCNELYHLQRDNIRIDATRGGKRGRRLELDRKNPNSPYDNFDNLVWCCYWCNNAKSNFFSDEEFKPIALAIGQVLSKI